MGLKKILKKLSIAISEVKSGDNSGGECEDLKSLIKKLRDKRSKLEKKLESSTDSSEIKAIKLDIKITDSQLKKARKTKRKHCKP